MIAEVRCAPCGWWYNPDADIAGGSRINICDKQRLWFRCPECGSVTEYVIHFESSAVPGDVVHIDGHELASQGVHNGR